MRAINQFLFEYDAEFEYLLRVRPPLVTSKAATISPNERIHINLRPRDFRY